MGPLPRHPVAVMPKSNCHSKNQVTPSPCGGSLSCLPAQLSCLLEGVSLASSRSLPQSIGCPSPCPGSTASTLGLASVAGLRPCKELKVGFLQKERSVVTGAASLSQASRHLLLGWESPSWGCRKSLLAGTTQIPTQRPFQARGSSPTCHASAIWKDQKS